MNKDNNIINDINIIDNKIINENNNKLNITNDLVKINNLENSINSVNDEYYIQLLLQYFKIKGIEESTMLPFLIKNNIYDFNSLISLYPEFLDYISLCDKLSEYYLSYLESNKNVDVNSPNTYEINKGEFDSASTEDMTIVSKYAGTMGLTPSMLHRSGDKVYKISEDGSFSIIPEGSTILIHNVYNIKDVLYVLLTFSGLDINVVIGAWGFKYYAKEHLDKLRAVLKIAEVLKCEDINITEPVEKDNVICSNITINTKNLVNSIHTNSLITNREKMIFDNFYENINNKEIELPTDGKTLKR